MGFMICWFILHKLFAHIFCSDCYEFDNSNHSRFQVLKSDRYCKPLVTNWKRNDVMSQISNTILKQQTLNKICVRAISKNLHWQRREVWETSVHFNCVKLCLPNFNSVCIVSWFGSLQFAKNMIYKFLKSFQLWYTYSFLLLYWYFLYKLTVIGSTPWGITETLCENWLKSWSCLILNMQSIKISRTFEPLMDTSWQSEQTKANRGVIVRSSIQH